MSDFLTPRECNIRFKGKMGSRRCVRVSHPSLKVRLSSGEEFPVKDLNTYGVAFKYKGSEYLPGEVLTLSVYFKDREVLKDWRAKVKRLAGDALCCEFMDLGRREEYTLDALIVEIQKEEIKKRKQKEE